MGMAQQQLKVGVKRKRVKKIRVENAPIRSKAYTKQYQKIKKTSNKLKISILSLFVITVIALSALLLMRYTQITQINNDITAIKKQISQLEAKRDYLNSQIEPYKSTQRIERIASINLGMTYPSEDRTIRIDYSKNRETTINAQKDNKVSKKYGIISYIRSLLFSR